MKFLMSISICILFVQIAQGIEPLKLVQEWNEIDFKFPSQLERQTAIETEDFIPGNPFILDSDVQYRTGGKTRIFVTTPRFGKGRPMTLGVITRVPDSTNALLSPYPDYSWHTDKGQNCNGMTSVLRVALDGCSRLWVLDTGKVDEDQVCPAKLLAFDLNTDELLIKHEFTNAYRRDSLLATPVIDVRDSSCENTFVYIADVTTYAIIVFDLANGNSWRVTDKYMYPHPHYGTFTVSGESFDLMDGVLGMALSPFKSLHDDRTLYFHAMASNTENIVKTSSIRNASLWSDGLFHPSEFRELPGRRHSQAAAEAIDKNGIMFFGLASQNAIACWNTATPFTQENIKIVAQNDEKLQFASGVKIVNNLRGGQELWVTTCRFQKIMNGSMSKNETNYRIMAANVKDVGVKCAHPKSGPGNLVSGGPSSTYGGAKYH